MAPKALSPRESRRRRFPEGPRPRRPQEWRWRRGRLPARGFTLVELVVVVVIVGILAAFAVPAYLKSVETGKADDAAALANMVGATNRMFAVDHGNAYTSGQLQNTDSLCQAGAACPAGGPFRACALVACKYLASQDWDSKPYAIAADAAGSSVCGGAPFSFGAGSYVACVKRKSSGTGSTGLSPYTSWGYTMDVNGVMTAQGGAPAPVQ